MYRRRMLLDSKNKKQKSDYESLPNKIKSSITISKKIKKQYQKQKLILKIINEKDLKQYYIRINFKNKMKKIFVLINV